MILYHFFLCLVHRFSLLSFSLIRLIQVDWLYLNRTTLQASPFCIHSNMGRFNIPIQSKKSFMLRNSDARLCISHSWCAADQNRAFSLFFSYSLLMLLFLSHSSGHLPLFLLCSSLLLLSSHALLLHNLFSPWAVLLPLPPLSSSLFLCATLALWLFLIFKFTDSIDRIVEKEWQYRSKIINISFAVFFHCVRSNMFQLIPRLPE